MANRTVKLGYGEQPKTKGEVYVDVSIDAKAESAGKLKTDVLADVKAVQNSLKNIFEWIPGERVLNPEFGSNLRKYMYQQITTENQEQIAAEIRNSVQQWEPRVMLGKIVNVTDVDDREENTVRLELHYRIRGLEDRDFVFSYDWNGNGRDA